MKAIRKLGTSYPPREHEIWIPVHMDDVPATEGYFISTEGRVAKMHVGPNPYNQSPWIALLPMVPLKGTGGPVIEFTLSSGVRKRAMLVTVFVTCFLGEGFLDDIKSDLRGKDKNNDSFITLKNLGVASKMAFHRRYNIADPEYWVLNRYCGYKIWPSVLGYRNKPISEVHKRVLARENLCCPPKIEEFVDALGVSWRPYISEESYITEMEGYWISSLGTVVQFNDGLDGPSELTGTTVQIGINCMQLAERPAGRGTSTFMTLKNCAGDTVNKSLRKMVYQTFIDPHYNGTVLSIHKNEGGNGINLLVVNKKDEEN